ncbi:MAG: hypothetical protein QG574_4076 [Cyanobacteriota bacterium erpe_2018_sw_21hr_WHONDRS-SW48-000092_B_bin.40]|jgi:hypothetical protein|nr:hypothetical protein [Cyanobacteriota bacterium erpe_2018_sw_21hr_WHONDRS-SW48-000092_B_bin.40]
MATQLSTILQIFSAAKKIDLEKMAARVVFVDTKREQLSCEYAKDIQQRDLVATSTKSEAQIGLDKIQVMTQR